MDIRTMRLLAVMGLAWLTCFSSSVLALKPADITEVEMKLLPSYCRDAQSFGYGDASFNTSPNAGKWVGMMGKSFWHIHHYCWALINVRRAQQPLTPSAKKRALLEEASGDLQYVIKNTTDDFVLLPEVLTYLGRTQVQLKQPQAVQSFTKAKTLKPDYWPPYYHLAEYLKARGEKAEAIEIVRAGLQHAPGTKPLLLLYHDLGGKPGDIPPPLAKPATEPADEGPTVDRPVLDAAPAPASAPQNP